MNKNTLKKKRRKLNPAVLLLAAESYFQGDVLGVDYPSEWSCIRIKLAKRVIDGLDAEEYWKADTAPERTFYENIFNCHYRTFHELTRQYSGSANIRDIRIMALCLAAELARQYNNKKGCSFSLHG